MSSANPYERAKRRSLAAASSITASAYDDQAPQFEPTVGAYPESASPSAKLDPPAVTSPSRLDPRGANGAYGSSPRLGSSPGHRYDRSPNLAPPSPYSREPVSPQRQSYPASPHKSNYSNPYASPGRASPYATANGSRQSHASLADEHSPYQAQSGFSRASTGATGVSMGPQEYRLHEPEPFPSVGAGDAYDRRSYDHQRTASHERSPYDRASGFQSYSDRRTSTDHSRGPSGDYRASMDHKRGASGDYRASVDHKRGLSGDFRGSADHQRGSSGDFRGSDHQRSSSDFRSADHKRAPSDPRGHSRTGSQLDVANPYAQPTARSPYGSQPPSARGSAVFNPQTPRASVLLDTPSLQNPYATPTAKSPSKSPLKPAGGAHDSLDPPPAEPEAVSPVPNRAQVKRSSYNPYDKSPNPYERASAKAQPSHNETKSMLAPTSMLDPVGSGPSKGSPKASPSPKVGQSSRASANPSANASANPYGSSANLNSSANHNANPKSSANLASTSHNANPYNSPSARTSANPVPTKKSIPQHRQGLADFETTPGKPRIIINADPVIPNYPLSPQVKKHANYNMKVVVVGDGGCGKTCLLVSYAQQEFPEVYVPTVFENYVTNVIAPNNKVIELALWDTAGQEEYDRLRPLSYPNVDVLLVCFSLESVVSLQNVKDTWFPEVSHFCPGIPVILVGTKADLASDIPPDFPIQVATDINAIGYIQCSAKSNFNINTVFNFALHHFQKQMELQEQMDKTQRSSKRISRLVGSGQHSGSSMASLGGHQRQASGPGHRRRGTSYESAALLSQPLVEDTTPTNPYGNFANDGDAPKPQTGANAYQNDEFAFTRTAAKKKKKKCVIL
ncbi:hypothetical protein DICA3_D24036 [Diutina catenulata]